jgi:hypothetical protein
MNARRRPTLVSLLALALAPSGAGCGASGSGEPAPPAEHVSEAVTSAPTVDLARRAADDDKARADLAADVRQRTEAARLTYGDAVPLRVESDLFVLVGAEKGVRFDEAADLAQRGLDVYLGSFFSRRPDRAVTVYVVRSAAAFTQLYGRLGSGLENNLGAYSRSTRDIIVNVGPGSSTILHELVHPLVQTDFPRAPSWFEEGIAALFEKPVFDPPGELHGAHNLRNDRLDAALASPAKRGMVHLKSLFAVDDEALEGPDQDVDYAMARTFCQWLDGRGQLWPFYRAWRDAVAEDATGEKSFARVTGMTVEEADAAWLAWVTGKR